MSYASQVKALLSPAQARVFKKLSSAKKIQDFLDHFPVVYFGAAGEPSVKSPLDALKAKKMHCMEGALVACAAFAYHGHKPMLMDLQSASHDYDHVVALFKQGGLWGAISKTNHPQLRWRDPVYCTPRELAMSYFNEYFWPERGKKAGVKTMTAYSAPFDLTKYKPGRWLATESLDWLAEELDQSPHYPALPASARRYLRRVDQIEITSATLSEWPKNKNKRKK